MTSPKKFNMANNIDDVAILLNITTELKYYGERISRVKINNPNQYCYQIVQHYSRQDWTMLSPPTEQQLLEEYGYGWWMNKAFTMLEKHWINMISGMFYIVDNYKQFFFINT